MEKTPHLQEVNSLALYLKEIGRNQTLAIEEEAALAIKIRQGDRRALERLVEANLRFVVSVARNYQNQGLPLSDLINEGNIGLVRAARRFDETKNFKFISYAVWWIRQSILQALAEQSRIIKLPLNRVGAIHKINKSQARLEQKLCRVPEANEIAAELAIEESEVEETMKIGNNHLSLDAPIQGSDDVRLMDLLQSDDQELPDARLVEVSLRDAVGKVLDTLGAREREVVRLYFGIGEDSSHTLEEIGQRFNLTRERARQIKEKALRRLKQHSRTEERLLEHRI